MTARNVRATTRERILDQAERLIAVKGIYGFTLRDIAAPLGVQVPAIYKHYKSRDDVLIEVSRRFIALLSTQFELRPRSSPGAELRAALAGFVEAGESLEDAVAREVEEETGARVKPAPYMGGPFVAAPGGPMDEAEPRAKDQSWTEHQEKPS